MKYYKALNYWVFGGFSGLETAMDFIDWAKSLGLDGVELTVGDCICINITEAECRKIKNHAEKQGIGLRTLATGNYWNCSIGAVDESERLQAVNFTKQYLRIASWLGVKICLVIPGASEIPWQPEKNVVSYKTVWEQSSKSLKELLSEAKQTGVSIALENVWGRFLFSPMEWKFFIEQFNSSFIGMYLDVGNCCLYVRPQDYIELLGTHIKAIHIKNWIGEDSGGGLHGFGENIQDGVVNFKSLKQSLEKINYQGPLTAEMIPFSRLPDLGIPDKELAASTVKKLIEIF